MGAAGGAREPRGPGRAGRGASPAPLLPGRSYSERILRAAGGPEPSPPGPSRSPPPAPRRPGPAVTPGRPGRCWAVGEAQENTLLRGGLGSLGSCFFFFLALGSAGPVRASLRGALTSPSGKPGRRPRLRQSCAGKRGAKEEFRLDPLLSLPSPPAAGWSLAGHTLTHCRPSQSPCGSGCRAGKGHRLCSAV